MAHHVQNSMPPHLQKYRGGNTYIPEHAQREMTEHLENNLPGHMKEYAGAYMQQHVVEPSIVRRGTATPPAPPETPAAAPQAPVVMQPTIQNPAAQTPGTPAPSPASPVPPPPAPAGSAAPPDPNNPDQQYEFITSPENPETKPGLLSSLSGGSIVLRVGVIAGAVLVLLILFVVGRSLFGGSSNVDSFLTVAQQQQEIIQIVSNAAGEEGQQNLSAGTRNLAATIEASITSSQSATVNYMTTNGKKINEKQLNLKVSAATDTQLADAAAAGTYNRTFREILDTKLNAYGSTLSQVYNQNPGPKGKELLQNEYKQLQLYQAQLKETANQ